MTRSTVEQYNEELAATPLDFVTCLVADHRNIDLADLPELHRYLNGDLINQFLRQPPAAGELRFRWDDVTVTLSADCTVEVTTTSGRNAKAQSNGGSERPQSGIDRKDGVGIRVTTE